MKIGEIYEQESAGKWKVVEEVNKLSYRLECISTNRSGYQIGTKAPFYLPISSDWVLVNKKKLLVRDIL